MSKCSTTPALPPHGLDEVGDGARMHAMSLNGGSRAMLLSESARDWDELTYLTLFYGGVYDTTAGATVRIHWEEFSSFLIRYSAEIFAKGTGLWFTPALSVNGRCRDCDIIAITQVSFDADGCGDWSGMRGLLERADIAHVIQASASHTPAVPKWHVHVPLALHWSGVKAEWRAIYRHARNWFSAAVFLEGSAGFDPATDRLGQPWFPAARRHAGDDVPETVVGVGRALDLGDFLVATGFTLPTPAPRASRPKKTRAAREGGATAADQAGLLERAFAFAGWLGREIGANRRAVLCPWRDQHTGGTEFDGSTVIFAPSSRAQLGWFHCAHAHCAARTQPEVLRAVPPDALAASLSGRRC